MESFLIVVFALAIYFLPSWTAAGRHVPNVGSVVVVNLFLGWTLIGWAVALAMAYRDPKPQPAGLPVLQPPTVRKQSGLATFLRGPARPDADRDWWKR